MNDNTIPQNPAVKQGSDERRGHVAGSTTEEAVELWERAGSIKEWTPVGIYLKSRGLWPLPPRTKLRQAKYAHGDPRFPTWGLIAPLTDSDSELRAVQVLVIHEDGNAKEIDGHKVRLSIGPTGGTRCRLVTAGRRLAIAEGVEDALALMKMYPDLACWATCGLVGMREFTPPRDPSVDDLLIFADHDHNGGQAALAGAKHVRALPKPRPLVSVLWSQKAGEDPFNVFACKGEFVQVWWDRGRRMPCAQWGGIVGSQLLVLLTKPEETWEDTLTKISEAQKVPKKDMLLALRAEQAERAFAKIANGAMLEVHPLRQEMYDRLDYMMPTFDRLFVTGEGAGMRVVAVEEVTEERRHELEKQEIYVITGQPMIVPVNQHMLADKIERCCVVFKETDSGPKRANLPMPIAQGWMASGRASCLPNLRGLAPYPVIRTDGEIVTEPGYDRRSAFWVTYAGAKVMVPAEPTEDEARAAVAAFIDKESGLFRKYPFETSHGRIGALAFILQMLDRHNHRLVPAWVFDAPTPRTGKMHLQRACSLLALGTPPVIYAMSDNREERHKRITHALIDGSPLVCLDNINGSFDSSDAATYLGEGRCLLRSYGMTGLSPLAVNSNTLAFTGNNITMTNDMQTRCCKIRLDAGMPDPDKRRFDFNAWDEVQANRAKWLMAALTILRWGSQTKPHKGDLPGFGLFDEFDARIRRPLYALTGIDVGLCLDDMRGENPEEAELGKVFELIQEMMKGRFTAADLLATFRDWRLGGNKKDHGRLLILPFTEASTAATIGTKLAEWQGKHGGGLSMLKIPRTGQSPAAYSIVPSTS